MFRKLQYLYGCMSSFLIYFLFRDESCCIRRQSIPVSHNNSSQRVRVTNGAVSGREFSKALLTMQFTSQRLHILCSRQENRATGSRTAHNSHTNYRYLSTADKIQRLHEMWGVQRKNKAQLKRIRVQLDKVVEEEGVEVDKEFHG